MKWLLALLVSTCAFCQLPPTYNGVTTTTAPISLTNPGFSPATTYNTVVYGPLNPTMNPDTVLTDRNWKCNNMGAAQLSIGNLTASGGDGDVMGSVPLPDGSMYIAVHLNGANCLLHIAFDPTTGAAKNITNGAESSCTSVNGAFSFSKSSPYVFYWFDHLLHQGTLTSDCTFTETKNSQFPFDYASCPGTGVAAGTVPKSTSSLGVSAYDRTLTMNLSWTGGQGTAGVEMVYQPGVGCAVLNLVTGSAYGFNGKLVGTETNCVDPNAAGGQGIHDSSSSNDGRIAFISGGAWQMWGGSNICWWEVGTTNTQSVSASRGPQTSGHNEIGSRTMLFLNNPVPNIRTIYPLTAANIASFQTIVKLPSGISDMHGAQAHQFFSDLTPYIIESSGVSVDMHHPLPYVNEVFGVNPFLQNAPILRFGTTWNTTASSGFGCSSGIGFISQDGAHWFYLSDGLQSFGLDNNGKPLCLLFSKTL